MHLVEVVLPELARRVVALQLDDVD